MDFSDFLAKLQKKPKPVKMRIMWAGTIFCLVFILFFWFWSLNDTITQSKGGEENQKLKTGLEQFAKDVPTVWGTLGAGIGSAFESIKNELINSPANEVPAEYWIQDSALPLE